MNKKSKVMLIVVVIISVLIVFSSENIQEIPECVPAQCCHATSCVLIELAPNCSDIICTTICQEETMDCGQGHCEFNSATEKCEVIWTNGEF